jgi:hypothetical protein
MALRGSSCADSKIRNNTQQAKDTASSGALRAHGWAVDEALQESPSSETLRQESNNSDTGNFGPPPRATLCPYLN